MMVDALLYHGLDDPVTAICSASISLFMIASASSRGTLFSGSLCTGGAGGASSIGGCDEGGVLSMATLSSIQPECVQQISGGHEDVLAAVEHEGLRRIRHVAQPRVPKRGAVGRVESHEVAGAIAGEEQSAGGREHARRPAAAGQLMTPGDPAGSWIDRRHE